MLTAQDREVLEDYRDAVKALGETKLGKRGFKISYRVTIGEGVDTEAEEMPDEAELAEFVMCFRPIWDDGEPASFKKVHNVLYQRGALPADELRELQEIHRDWRRAEREAAIRVNRLRPRRFIEMYFYSDRYFHRGDRAERVERESYEAAFGRNFMRVLFIDPMIEQTRAAVDLAQLVVRALG